MDLLVLRHEQSNVSINQDRNQLQKTWCLSVWNDCILASLLVSAYHHYYRFIVCYTHFITSTTWPQSQLHCVMLQSSSWKLSWHKVAAVRTMITSINRLGVANPAYCPRSQRQRILRFTQVYFACKTVKQQESYHRKTLTWTCLCGSACLLLVITADLFDVATIIQSDSPLFQLCFWNPVNAHRSWAQCILDAVLIQRGPPSVQMKLIDCSWLIFWYLLSVLRHRMNE